MLNQNKKDVNVQGWIVTTDCGYDFESLADQYDIAYARYSAFGKGNTEYDKIFGYAYRLRTTRFEFNVFIEDFKRTCPAASIMCFNN